MRDILVVGSINIDYGISCERFPQMGETVRGSGFERQLGGKGLNQAVAAHKYMSNVYLCGCVGKDNDAEYVKTKLLDVGMTPQYIYETLDESTGAAVVIRHGGDNAIIIHEGANGHLTFEDVVSTIESLDVAYLILQFEIPYHLVKRILTYCKQVGIRVVVNTAPAIAIDDEDYGCIETLILNQTETLFYTGILPVDRVTSMQASHFFINKGVKQVIITLGSEGSFYTDKDTSISQSACVVDVVDTTGAGDAFVGVYVSVLNETSDVKQALQYASIAGSLTCEKIGAMSASPTREEIIQKNTEDRIV